MAAEKRAKEAEKERMKLLLKKREDLEKSIEDNVFQRDRIEESKVSSAEDGFSKAADRLTLLREEEKELKELEAFINFKPKERVLLVEEFDKVQMKYRDINKDISNLENDKVNLEKKLESIRKMKKELEKGINKENEKMLLKEIK